MKKKIQILLTLTLTPFMVNCSGKPMSSQLPSANLPVPTTQTPTQTTTRPSIGTPIFVPNTEPPVRTNPTPRRNVPSRSVPREDQLFKHGESYYNSKFKLPSVVKESSGLIKLDGQLWTLNDSGGKPALYQLSERNGKIVKVVTISNARNRDWEDIAFDDTYVYIGDFGNNRGNRKDLKIYKIPRASLRTQKRVRAEVITFNYSDQRDFSSRPQQNNFDCEAMVAHNGKLYLFSKNWQNSQTRLYVLNTTTGKQTARYLSSFNTEGMVTGATLNKELDILLLSTYSALLNVNIWAFTNFHGDDFFNGQSKRLNFSTPLQGQVEGITFIDNYKAYLSSEAFKKYIFTFDATLYTLDFSGEFE